MKISDYFTILALIAGLRVALSGSWWLYSAYIGFDSMLLNTFFGLIFIYLLLKLNKTSEWFWSGFFIGILWFWWIGVSFYYYHLSWAIPIAVLGVGIVYGVIFWIIGVILKFLISHFSLVPEPVEGLIVGVGTPRPTTSQKEAEPQHRILNLLPTPYSLLPLMIKAILLLSLSYLHPLGFDWFKPELVFAHSYLGVDKWRFIIVLFASALSIWRRQPLFLLLSLLAYSPIHIQKLQTDPTHTFKLVSTHTTIKEKWDITQKQKHIDEALSVIDKAIDKHYKAVVLPESVMPFFVNHDPRVLGELIKRSEQIDIIIGALYWDDGIHRNSTYFFHQGKYKVANKVVLVPFGESNPLPKWASDIVNRIFFDGAIDYIASAEPTDWEINGTKYRNAICYEATSEKLYKDKPKNMIAISNNAWFVPSVEPTYQRLLMEYYVRKYDTTIYHANNMTDSYIIRSIKWK